MAYKINKEYEQLIRVSDETQKTCKFTDYCFDKIKEGVFRPLEGDRAKYYSWAQVIFRELSKLSQEERDALVVDPYKEKTYSLGEVERDRGDWMRHDVGFCRERKQKHRVLS